MAYDANLAPTPTPTTAPTPTPTHTPTSTPNTPQVAHDWEHKWRKDAALVRESLRNSRQVRPEYYHTGMDTSGDIEMDVLKQA